MLEQHRSIIGHENERFLFLSGQKVRENHNMAPSAQITRLFIRRSKFISTVSSCSSFLMLILHPHVVSFVIVAEVIVTVLSQYNEGRNYCCCC